MSDPNFMERTQQISAQIREALRKAFPAPMEQFLTVMVPGKVVNLEDFSGGFDQDGKLTGVILPVETELNQAILCDDMPVLGPVQLGPTGKSVSRCYDAALSKLIPAGTTIGVDVKDPSSLTDEEKRYRDAMQWLTAAVPKFDGKTRIEVYSEKQEAYTNAVQAKLTAFDDARKSAENNETLKTLEEKKAAYYDWVNENARTYRNFIQAKYMDWVVNGLKEEVEYWFAVVDRDSAMSRVEASKEAMRNSAVESKDGSVEFQKVTLDPSHWAILAKKKAKSGQSQTKTVDWYNWEIARLQDMNGMLSALTQTPVVTSERHQAPDDGSESTADSDLTDKMKQVIIKRDAWQHLIQTKASKEDQQTAYDAYQNARSALATAQSSKKDSRIQSMNADALEAQMTMYDNLQGNSGAAAKTIESNNSLIEQYTSERKKLLNTGSNLVDDLEDATNVPKEKPQEEEDYFTAITIELSSSHSDQSSSSSSSSFSYGASMSWGFWFWKKSASVNASWSETTSQMQSEMVKNNMKISFECMRVDITRPWLRTELFYDADLTTGPQEFLSPGFNKLRELMENSPDLKMSPETVEEELNRYSTFPLYPTAFLLAANVVLEISGETSKLQTYFHESSASGSFKGNAGGFSLGPFSLGGGSVNSSYSRQSQSSDATCDATSDGCRITMKSPQIIAWISEMVPALPRLTKDQIKNLKSQSGA